MFKKIFVAVFLAAFGIAMTNVTFASSGDMMCTQQYQPVCGYVQVQCIRAPCYPVPQTFGNSCEAERAGATAITQGACDTNARYNRLADTSRTLQTFNSAAVTGSKPTLSFSGETFSAKVCNSIAGSYVVGDNVIQTSKVISTMMACLGPVQTYENAFDLSGAHYELSTDGANHLMITTADGNTFQWSKVSATTTPTKPTVTARSYGFVGRQIEQLIKARANLSLADKQAFVQGIIDKIDEILMRAKYTPYGMYKIKFVRNALEYYLNHLTN